MNKLISITLAAIMLFTVSIASADTVMPDADEYEGLAGHAVNATVGAYSTEKNTFTVTLYKNDSFDAEDIEKLTVGDILLAGGQLYQVKEKAEDESGEIRVLTEDGNEIIFIQISDDHMSAQSTDDDRRFMHAFAVLDLPVAEEIVYEDNSDPEKTEAVITRDLEAILKIKAEKEETSIGFDYYATLIELNHALEIIRIHQDFDVAQ